MRKSTKHLDKQLKKNPTGLIVLAGFLAFVSLAFVGACLYKIYDSAYTTYLSCNKQEFTCTIKKQDILGGETVQYEFSPYKLGSVELEEQKNILGQQVYTLVLESDEKNGKKYLLTGETETKEKQQVYLDQINQFLGYYRSELLLENTRYKLKFIGLAAAGAGSLVALFLIFDCIKGILKLRKKQNENPEDILNPGGFF